MGIKCWTPSLWRSHGREPPATGRVAQTLTSQRDKLRLVVPRAPPDLTAPARTGRGLNLRLPARTGLTQRLRSTRIGLSTTVRPGWSGNRPRLLVPGRRRVRRRPRRATRLRPRQPLAHGKPAVAAGVLRGADTPVGQLEATVSATLPRAPPPFP